MKYKKYLKTILVTTLTLTLSNSVFGLPKHKNENLDIQSVLTPINYTSYLDNNTYENVDINTLWDTFLTADANEKLSDLKLKKFKEQNISLKPKNREMLYYLSLYNKDSSYNGIINNQYNIEQTEYSLKQEKEIYKLQKKQAEQALKMLGEIKDAKLLEYELYTNGDLQTTDYSYLLQQQVELKMQIENCKTKMKTLEYSYMLSNIDDESFISSYKDLKTQLQKLENNNKSLDVKIKYLKDMTRFSYLLP